MRERIRSSLRIIRILRLCRSLALGGSLVTGCSLLFELLEPLLALLRRGVDELFLQAQDAGL